MGGRFSSRRATAAAAASRVNHAKRKRKQTRREGREPRRRGEEERWDENEVSLSFVRVCVCVFLWLERERLEGKNRGLVHGRGKDGMLASRFDTTMQSIKLINQSSGVVVILFFLSFFISLACTI